MSLRKEKQQKDEKDKHVNANQSNDSQKQSSFITAKDMLKTWKECNICVDVDKDAFIDTLIDILDVYNEGFL